MIVNDNTCTGLLEETRIYVEGKNHGPGTQYYARSGHVVVTCLVQTDPFDEGFQGVSSRSDDDDRPIWHTRVFRLTTNTLVPHSALVTVAQGERPAR